ncbi:uncharacterized protein N7515_009415 [Penicillium bovifimosum]|uniref:Uncharacterized protein n=1 Tax=Penicillium bovifimosum TaxID=126998 RepID=A0A9W9GKC4_9EURO|nr:uncharacterized protein N7515_009415 [Penicillium bovifimosum]KAJ5121454.1 hypothetical protein N7515_009415 [Penicillium bovifimosum]
MYIHGFDVHCMHAYLYVVDKATGPCAVRPVQITPREDGWATARRAWLRLGVGGSDFRESVRSAPAAANFPPTTIPSDRLSHTVHIMHYDRGEMGYGLLSICDIKGFIAWIGQGLRHTSPPPDHPVFSPPVVPLGTPSGVLGSQTGSRFSLLISRQLSPKPRLGADDHCVPVSDKSDADIFQDGLDPIRPEVFGSQPFDQRDDNIIEGGIDSIWPEVGWPVLHGELPDDELFPASKEEDAEQDYIIMDTIQDRNISDEEESAKDKANDTADDSNSTLPWPTPDAEGLAEVS